MMDREKIASCKFKDDVERAVWFNEIYLKQKSNVPVHFAPSHRNSEVNKIVHPGDRRPIGQKPAIDLLVCWSGLCSGPLHGYCPTHIFCGFRYEAVHGIGKHNTFSVKMIIGFRGLCIHDPRRDVGRLTGSARKRQTEEVS